jgi:predicted PurR-regulated permease PerM
LIQILNSLTPLVNQLEQFLRDRKIQVDLETIEQQFRSFVLSGIGYSLAILQTSLTNLATLILIAVVAFFMLLDGKRLWNLILKILPRGLRNRFSITVQRKFLGFFRGQLLLMLFLITSTFIVFLILQAPFPLLLALIAGTLDAIPGIGATLGISIVVLILLTQGAWLALKALIACIILQQIQDNLIAPRVMQNALNVNPVVTFFALLVGVRVAGLLGVFLAVPLAGVIVSFLEIDEMKGEV